MSPWQQSALDQSIGALVEGRLGHALLVAGPAHLGKQEFAEALAKRILCHAPQDDGMACGHCRSCQLFVPQMVGLATMHAHSDLQRVTLEPNEKGDKLRTEITVDQIRKLGQWFSLTSQFGKGQVAILHPADLMNPSAANALLKTLEEPAPDRFLLLVTSDPGRLPATVRSRCQRVDFALPDEHAALDWLLGQQFTEGQARPALAAARGNPGLAAVWLRNGGLQLRADVLAQLNAVGSGRAGAIETAQRWLADQDAEMRLRFAADLALDAAGAGLGKAPAASGLLAPADFAGLSRWFDSINRTREQLRAPLRNDLVLAGLLREWRNMMQAGR